MPYKFTATLPLVALTAVLSGCASVGTLLPQSSTPTPAPVTSAAPAVDPVASIISRHAGAAVQALRQISEAESPTFVVIHPPSPARAGPVAQPAPTPLPAPVVRPVASAPVAPAAPAAPLAKPVASPLATPALAPIPMGTHTTTTQIESVRADGKTEKTQVVSTYTGAAPATPASPATTPLSIPRSAPAAPTTGQVDVVFPDGKLGKAPVVTHRGSTTTNPADLSVRDTPMGSTGGASSDTIWTPPPTPRQGASAAEIKQETINHALIAGGAVPLAVPPGLDYPITIRWHGDMEPLVERVVRSAGWSYGAPSGRKVTPVVVAVAAENKSAHEVLRDIAALAGSAANLHVDARTRTVTVRYP